MITVGIVDYGFGNQASVSHTMHELGFRVRIGHTPEILDAVDVLLLPGVGAYPPAMAAIAARGLNIYLKEQVRKQRPLVGICLGMQLLATAGHEHGFTAGLDLIPGKVVPLQNPRRVAAGRAMRRSVRARAGGTMRPSRSAHRTESR